mmetsp:Transcript_9355/g.38332  ORF Transcript_9355/g.38332 Transcript_9355/m.38332 type:complete len:306 (+) Transcript_9355:1648-2565(+)
MRGRTSFWRTWHPRAASNNNNNKRQREAGTPQAVSIFKRTKQKTRPVGACGEIASTKGRSLLVAGLGAGARRAASRVPVVHLEGHGVGGDAVEDLLEEGHLGVGDVGSARKDDEVARREKIRQPAVGVDLETAEDDDGDFGIQAALGDEVADFREGRPVHRLGERGLVARRDGAVRRQTPQHDALARVHLRVVGVAREERAGSPRDGNVVDFGPHAFGPRHGRAGRAAARGRARRLALADDGADLPRPRDADVRAADDEDARGAVAAVRDVRRARREARRADGGQPREAAEVEGHPRGVLGVAAS